MSSDEFQALTGEQPGRTQGDGMRAMVQAAVSGLLVQQGHMVTAAEEDDLLVLPPAAALKTALKSVDQRSEARRRLWPCHCEVVQGFGVVA
ncbi:hypothetical protein ACWGA9_25570 [Streptomyces sp. NPDC054950]